MFHSIRQENTVLRKPTINVAQFLNSLQQGDTPSAWMSTRSWESSIYELKKASLEIYCRSSTPPDETRPGVTTMDLNVWVDGRVTSPRIGSMDSVQVGKAAFVTTNSFNTHLENWPFPCVFLPMPRHATLLCEPEGSIVYNTFVLVSYELK